MADTIKKRLFSLDANKFIGKHEKTDYVKKEEYVTTFATLMDVKTLRTDDPTDKPPMYLYDNGYFVRGAETYFKETNYRLFGTLMNRGLNSDLIHRLQAFTYDDSDYFENPDPYLLNVANGVLNFSKKELLPHSPDYRMTTMLPVKFDPDAEYGFFEEFVSSIVDGKDCKIIQEMFGYCLLRDYFIQKAFMLTGSGANGKGVLLYCLMMMLGMENCSSVNLVNLTSNRFMMAELHRKYANISNETPSRKLQETEIFKSLRGGDQISAQRKFGHPFQFINYAKLVFAANKIPSTPDETFAFWRSWIIVKFPHRFVGADCNKNLKYELTTPERLSGILKYSIKGLFRLLENKDFSYSKSTDDVKEEWQRSADSALAFISSEIVEKHGGSITTSDILERYHGFCFEYGLQPEPEIGFWKRWNLHMKSYFPNAMKKQKSGGGKGTYYWRGIAFKNP